MTGIAVVGLLFTEQAGTGMRWLVGAVVALGDDAETAPWQVIELPRPAWIPCPGGATPSSALVVLHRRLAALVN